MWESILANEVHVLLIGVLLVDVGSNGIFKLSIF